MIWKYELNVDDQQTAKKFKEEIVAISRDIVVNVSKNKSQYMVKSSLQNVAGLDNKVNVDRQLKTLYDKYGDKITYNDQKNESYSLVKILNKIK